MRLRLIIVLVLTIFTGQFLVTAQDDPQFITAGTYTGSISDDDPADRYQFEGIMGQEITILMEATGDNTLDAALSLFDANNVLIQTDDDSGGNRNARIQFVPQINGIFIIEATRYQLNPPLTTGDYQLTLGIRGTEQGAIDPLSIPPDFSVDFLEIDLNTTQTASFDGATNLQYYVFGAQQGDFVRVELNTRNNLQASTRILSRVEQNLVEISRTSETTDTSETIFATIPQTGWYLIEVERLANDGAYDLSTAFVSDTLLSVDNPITSAFSTNDETLSFVFNATINERVFVNLTVTEGNNLEPEITILDLNQDTLAQQSSTGSQVRASLTIPRSAPYIVQIRNLNNRRGAFNLQLRRIPVDISKLPVRPISYNEQRTGTIDNDLPIQYFEFNGKAGELVTVQMNAVSTPATLDPYLILADSNLNELIFNDNVSASRSARIAQFALPADGTYYILATRAGLARGNTTGDYELDITVGALQIEDGLLTATLEWEGDADLNLFMRTPNGTISWARPTTPAGGQLQIDSNTGCETPTAQPIEHIFWDENDPLLAGDYTFWVWYQQDCMMAGITDFTLSIRYAGEQLLPIAGTIAPVLEVGERYETSLRVTDGGNVFPVDTGTITTPSAQQTESQGGDQLVVYGDQITGSISNEVFAQFYQFEGNAGDQVVIIVERVTSDLDPIAVLRTTNEVNLASNDDISPQNRNSRIIEVLPEDGRYVIAVTRYGVRDGTTTGNYRLTLSRIVVPDFNQE